MEIEFEENTNKNAVKDAWQDFGGEEILEDIYSFQEAVFDLPGLPIALWCKGLMSLQNFLIGLSCLGKEIVIKDDSQKYFIKDSNDNIIALNQPVASKIFVQVSNKEKIKLSIKFSNI